MIHSIKLNVALLACVATLSACGGGGGSNTGSSPVDPVPPTVPKDTTPPTLAANFSVSPANGSTTVLPDATVSFTMSESLASAQVNMLCNQEVISGETKVDGVQVSFKPTKNLKANVECVATLVSAGTKDLAGNSLVANTVVTNFTVKSLSCPSNLPSNPAPSFNGTSTIAICNNIYVDPSVAVEDYSTIVDNVITANTKLSKFFGSQIASSPDIIICNSASCVNYFADYANQNVTIYPNGKAGQYNAVRTTVVIVQPYALNLSALPHELTHVEIAARTNNVVMNAWFNEGLATYVAGQPFCPTTSAKGIDNLKKLDVQLAWNTYISNQAEQATAFNTYCQARNEVSSWIGIHGESSVVDMLTKLGSGQDFYTLYGNLLN